MKFDSLSFISQTVNFNLENYSLDMVFRILYAIEYWNHNPKHCGRCRVLFSCVVILHDNAYSFISELVVTCYRIRQTVCVILWFFPRMVTSPFPFTNCSRAT